MKKVLSLFIFLFALSATQAQDISQYNVVWDTQSMNSSQSMPLGGGDIGCNVWVENNELLIYLGRSGTFDENGSMLKLGRVRVSLFPIQFTKNFRQELKLKQGYIEITGDNHTRIRLWVEVYKPVLHMEIMSSVKLETTAVLRTGG